MATLLTITLNNMDGGKVIILGADGTLGQALQRVFADSQLELLTSAQIDVTQPDSLERVLVPLLQQPGVKLLINATAINAVDKITTDPATNTLAYAVNGKAPGVLAALAQEHDARFVHFGTDYVFAGTQRTPYTEQDTPDPQSEYAKSKRAGEISTLEANPDALVIRTSRLFGAPGKSAMSKKSFVDMVKQGAAEGKPMQFVDEEVAGPTWVDDLAAFTRQLIDTNAPGGVYHGTNAGQCTWFSFAQEILRQLGSSLPITPVPASTWPRPAARPAYSVLISTKVPPLRDWKEALAEYLKQG